MSSNVKNLLKIGFNNFYNKNYDKSKDIFEKILLIDYYNLKANHALGVIYGIQNDHEKALEFFEIALKQDTNFQPSLLNMAISLNVLRKYQRSDEIFKKLIKINPNNPDYYLNFGSSLYSQKRFKESKENLIKSVNLNTTNPQTYFQLGMIELLEKNFEDSIAYFLKSLNIDKENIEIIYRLGENYFFIGNYKKSIEYFKKCISSSDNQKLLFNAKEKLARSYLELKDYDESIGIYNEILNLELDSHQKAKIFSQLSNVYIDKNNKDFDADYSLSYHYSKESLKLDENNIHANNSMGIIQLYMRNHNESLKYFHKALLLDPSSSATLKNISNAYSHIGLYEKNIEIVKRFKELYPDNNALDSNYAMSLFSLGRFKEGFHYYEDRWNEKRADGTIRVMPNFSKPKWEPCLGSKKILIWGEQGVGDQILHGTMLHDFAKNFEKVYLAIDPKLVSLFSDTFPNITVYSLFEETSNNFYDYHLPLCSIGNYCRHSYSDFKKAYPYSISNIEDYEPSKDRLRCALSWKSVNGRQSDFKSTTLESLQPILELKNIDFYSIQYSDSDDEIDLIKDKYGITVHKVQNLDAFNDIYGLMKFLKSCDFTISTSSTNAHLSGALNIPTYLLLAKAYGKFWYWDNIFNGKNVWYPSVKRFVQKEYKSWEHPINELHTFLKDKYVC